ncbi:undecaprenyl-diphosphatase [Bacillus cereus]|uniref:Undecaprenyl-diphosphatase n=1 Tax=Bacillus cereus TaxID=1396 RepID=A0A9X7CH33_BACCE|nr:undecaprenyl-diphosphatase [Bacillus cereus]PGS63652.1 undecaprenyl-diphosphatase [Bacillus cereus]
MNYQLFRKINNLAGQSPILDVIMVFFTQQIIIIYAIFLLIMWFNGAKRIALYTCISGGLALFINYIIALLYFEPRPFVTHHVHVLVQHAADASFPSNHTTGVFALAVAVLLRKNLFGYGMLLLAVVTGVSRVWVGHHYPFDVLASIVVGSITSILLYKFTFLMEPFVNFIIRIYEKIVIFLKRRISK